MEPLSRRLEWFAFICLLVAEFILFDQFGAKPVTKVLPLWNDQIQYLSEAYQGYETLHSQGVVAALKRTLLEPTSQGTLHDFWATAVFAIAGPSRSAALAVNMLFFLGWQVLFFLTLQRVFNSRPLAWAGIAMLAALQMPWAYVPGSATDFRLDFMAAATFGMCCCTCYLTERFSNRLWSILFGVTVGLCFGTRFITGTYFLLILPGLALWVLCSKEARPRFRNFVYAGVATFLITAPLFRANREQMMDYYYYGHIVGPESSIRNTASSFFESIRWIGLRFWHGDLGSLWQGIAFIGTLGFLGCLILSTPCASPDEDPPITPALLFFGVPCVILGLHPQKSEVVLSILVPGAVMMLLILWKALLAKRTGLGPVCVSALVTMLGLGLFTNDMLVNPVPQVFRENASAAISICNRITSTAGAAGLEHPRIGVDHITDQIDAQVFRVISYERTRKWIPLEMTLPASIDRLTPRELEQRMLDSDFFLLTEPPFPGCNWPYDVQMREQHPLWKAWCDKHLTPVKTYDFPGRKVTLYQRSTFPLPAR